MPYQWLYRRQGLLRLVAGVLFALLVLALVALALRVLGHWWGWLAGLVVAVGLAFIASRVRRWVPRRTLLEVDFERGVVEKAPTTPSFGAAAERRPLALRDVLDALERAGDDRRVVGLLARVGSFRPGLAVAQELRDAVLAFRAKGKRAIAWAETIGEGGSATVEVYFASAFDQVHLCPVGEVGLDGVLVKHPFAKRALEKVGVKVQMDHRREYKAAMYLFTEEAFNEPHRESTQALLDSQVDQIVAGIAAGRGLEEKVVRELVDGGPFHASEAVDAGLVDRLSYRDEVYARAKEELKAKLLYLDRYLKRAGRPHRKGATIAVLQGVGSIARGASRSRSLMGGPTLGSDDVCVALRRAAKSKRVKAIVLRVDSPGGSAVASDAMWREVGRAREEGTPVVVSMGNVAASGGYYMAMGADRVLAQPGTITGSIGVVWGKFVTREAWAKLGFDFDSLQFGSHADIWSSGHEFSESGWQKLQGMLDRVYVDFTGKVATSRGLDPEKVEEVAKGRVWTGSQAKEVGLIDELGGYARALEVARELAELPADAPVKLKVFLPRKRFLGAMKPDESSEAAAALAPLADVAQGLGLVAPPGPLTLPPLHLSTSPTYTVRI